MEPLFEPLRLPNGTTLKNRFMKAATSELLATRGSNPTIDHIRLYQRIARGGTGLIITGNVMVDRRALGEPGNVVVEDRRDMAVLTAWARAVSREGAQLWMQINHPGKQSPRTLSKEPVAPSAVPMGEKYRFAFNPPRALTVPEIDDLVTRFVTTSVIAKEAGFTGVEIHAAHGYLVSQFLSPHDNRRTDEYGGSLENRMRFLVRIYEGMRAALGDSFPIGLKLNSSDFQPDGLTEEESIEVVRRMAALGVDLVEISGGNYENPAMQGGDGEGVFFLEYARRLKSLVDVPLALTGGFRTAETMGRAVADGETDLVGIARALVLDPDLPRQVADHTFETVPVRHLTTGIRSLDKKLGAYISNSYYAQQMHRLAKGKQPQLHTNAWKPLAFALGLHGPAAILPHRGR